MIQVTLDSEGSLTLGTSPIQIILDSEGTLTLEIFPIKNIPDLRYTGF